MTLPVQATRIVEEVIAYLEAGLWFDPRDKWQAGFVHSFARPRRKQQAKLSR